MQYAQPSDIEIHPRYGWKLYKVVLPSTKKSDSTSVKDRLQVQKGKKTRALKRRATEEDDEASLEHESDKESDFSSEPESEDDEPRRGRKKNKKDKAPKESKEEKARKKKTQKVKDAAKKAYDKVAPLFKEIRGLMAHECYDDLELDDTAACQGHNNDLSKVIKGIRAAMKSGTDEYTRNYGALDFKQINKDKRALFKKLDKAFRRM